MSSPPIRDARCLVTGGAGFIGSNLVRALLAEGASVTVLDDLSTGSRSHLPEDPRLTFVAADLRHEPLAERVRGHHYVFHLAAQVGNLKSILAPEADATANVVGTVRLLHACAEAGVRKLVYSSSSAIFGEARSLPIAEDHPQDPASFYALSKLTGERYALLARALWGLPAVALRYFNVFGLPMEDSEYTGVISIFLRRLARREPLIVYGDGEQFRDFVHVEDVVQANLLAAAGAEPGAVYNVGTGVRTSVRDLAEAVQRVAGLRVGVRHEPARSGEVAQSVADVTRIRAELGYRPRRDLESGLAELWREVRDGGAETAG
ncbi:MAG TPA: NAD-dependent epimerase/dehydratase family protein [Thermoanaerobaculia bacterium]|nr:NAD-dependent epimerase/dehydratase family protein [Thermoanaerobaculia bacterium]